MTDEVHEQRSRIAELERERVLREGIEERADIMDRRHDERFYRKLEKQMLRSGNVYGVQYGTALREARWRYEGGERPDARYEIVNSLFRMTQQVKHVARKYLTVMRRLKRYANNG